MPEAEGARVSVVIPHYNDLLGLEICLAMLAAQTYPAALTEIIIADNNSRCGIDAVVETAKGRARIVPAPIQGAGPARNAGAEAATGDILAFIDSDCLPEVDWIAKGVAALQDTDFIGGRVITTARDPARPNAVEAFELVFNFDFKRYIEKLGFTGTGNMFVRRDVFLKVGGFRTGVAEDMEWSFRARGLGYRLAYAPLAIVSHPARTNWADLRGRWERMEREHWDLAREQPNGRLKWLLKTCAMPASILPHAVKVLLAPQLPDLGARFRAIGVLARLRLFRTGLMLALMTGL